MPQRHYLKPSWLFSRVVNPLLMRLGVVSTLRVQGRKTGHWRRVPVNVLELDGERYLVALRGETDWVRNLRAAGSGQLQYDRRRIEPFTAVEVPDAEKPRLIAAYLNRWGESSQESVRRSARSGRSPDLSARIWSGLMSHSVFLARRQVASIHRVAENGPSRKLIYGILDAYTLGAGQRCTL